jgi:septum site-determining protein MinC
MIAIKGLRQGLLIVFSGTGDEPWLSRLRELENKLNANPGFFKGGTVAFDIKQLVLTDDDVRRSITLLKQHDVTLWAIVGQDEATQRVVRSVGLADALAQLPPQPSQATQPVASAPATPSTPATLPATNGKPDTPATPQAPPSPSSSQEEHADVTDGLLVRRRVRSGQVLRHPGHIVVIGDVNPGAQLLAGGDIIVWGKLQGAAHAGALGDDKSVICALDMSPQLVKIADAALSLRSDERRKRNKQGKPETAQLIDQQITFTTWA